MSFGAITGVSGSHTGGLVLAVELGTKSTGPANKSEYLILRPMESKLRNIRSNIHSGDFEPRRVCRRDSHKVWTSMFQYHRSPLVESCRRCSSKNAVLINAKVNHDKDSRRRQACQERRKTTPENVAKESFGWKCDNEEDKGYTMPY